MKECSYCGETIVRWIPARPTRPGLGPDGKWHWYPETVWVCSLECREGVIAIRERGRERYG